MSPNHLKNFQKAHKAHKADKAHTHTDPPISVDKKPEISFMVNPPSTLKLYEKPEVKSFMVNPPSTLNLYEKPEINPTPDTSGDLVYPLYYPLERSDFHQKTVVDDGVVIYDKFPDEIRPHPPTTKPDRYRTQSPLTRRNVITKPKFKNVKKSRKSKKSNTKKSKPKKSKKRSTTRRHAKRV